MILDEEVYFNFRIWNSSILVCTLGWLRKVVMVAGDTQPCGVIFSDGNRVSGYLFFRNAAACVGVLKKVWDVCDGVSEVAYGFPWLIIPPLFGLDLACELL